ncbi:MAG: SufD family Fe-S cluster assembly protein [Candidatus Micrarchaeota archaeon]|nr:SufD family Fe-S cluster assembly protein [Candidatus Micrarchaeota archaeon]
MKNYKYLLKEAESPDAYIEEVGIEDEEVITGDYEKVFVGTHKVRWKLKGKGTLWVYYLESMVKESWEIEGDFHIFSVVKPENYTYLKREVRSKGKVRWGTLVLGESELYSHYSLEGELEERGIAFLKEETIRWESTLLHAQPHGKSYSHVRALLNKGSHAQIRGLIDIGPEASDTNSYLEQHVILLDEDSHAFTWPALRIKNNQVRASHSSSISKVPEDMIFYLQTRGLTPQEGISLLAKGYLESVMPSEKLWEKVIGKL